MKKIMIWAFSLMLVCHSAFSRQESNLKLEIYQIKVEIGHATLVVVKSTGTPATIHSSTLIDAGNYYKDGQTILKVINEHAQGRLDQVFITHFDQDHWGGLIGQEANGRLTSDPLKRGLLYKRCETNNTFYKKNNKPVKVFLSNAANNIKPANLSSELVKYNTAGTLKAIAWKADTDLYLGPPCDDFFDAIMFRSLAIDGKLRNSTSTLTLGTDSHFRNNSSGVGMVVWRDFSFLIQGDMQAAETNEIKRTTFAYRNIGTPDVWQNDPIKQNAISQPARTAVPSSIDKKFIYRSALSTFEKSEGDVATNYGYFPYFAANPNVWHHELGKTINTYNGDNAGYAQTCIALVPHHGALTSNLWFRTKHAIIGSNQGNKHDHPKLQTVLALRHTSGVRNFYFTYLTDKSLNKGKSTELSKIKTKIDRGTDKFGSVHVLDGEGPMGSGNNGDFFKITVDHNSHFEVHNEAGTSLTSNGTCTGLSRSTTTDKN